MNKPEVKKFSKGNPCTKLEIWNCFRGSSRRFRRVQVDEAKSIIGANAPRVMLANNRIVVVEAKGVEYFQLTKDGESWLKKGMTSFCGNHPDRLGDVNFPLRGWA